MGRGGNEAILLPTVAANSARFDAWAYNPLRYGCTATEVKLGLGKAKQSNVGFRKTDPKASACYRGLFCP